MDATLRESMPKGDTRSLPGGSSRGPEVAMVEFHGRLPAQPAGFLGRLSRNERRKVYVLLGTFKEVRGLVGVGRRLHRYLRQGPLAAARGRITFGEYTQRKAEILRAIHALRLMIHRAALEACLILPRIPHDRREVEVAGSGGRAGVRAGRKFG